MTNDEFDRYPFWEGQLFQIPHTGLKLPLHSINSELRVVILHTGSGHPVRYKAREVVPDLPEDSARALMKRHYVTDEISPDLKPKPPTTHIMLDLETMGTGQDAAIIAIGAVAFTESGITNTFYGKVSLASSVACGLTIDAETVLWWLKQSDEARAEFAENSQDPNLHVQLVNFFNFATDSGATQLWGCGAGFDNTIIRTAFKKTNLPFSSALPYTADRCYRTMKAQFPEIEFERVGNHHHALDDAKSQALHLIKIWEQLHAK